MDEERVLVGNRTVRALAFAATAALALSAGGVAAHGGAAEDKPGFDYANADEHPFGKASDPATAVRTIEFDMSDTLRFEPGTIEVARGESVRLVVHNRGTLMHEMVLGTREALEQHAELMRRFPGMEHSEPYMAHVAPGGHGEIGWTFTQSGEYFYGCLVAGHLEGGMIGRIVVR